MEVTLAFKLLRILRQLVNELHVLAEFALFFFIVLLRLFEFNRGKDLLDPVDSGECACALSRVLILSQDRLWSFSFPLLNPDFHLLHNLREGHLMRPELGGDALRHRAGVLRLARGRRRRRVDERAAAPVRVVHSDLGLHSDLDASRSCGFFTSPLKASGLIIMTSFWSRRARHGLEFGQSFLNSEFYLLGFEIKHGFS
eukprot:CAMPEP_0168333092 /NCGR_PEP_ID=MMETSP0213-20121227/9380_1 /TAXON_ID=151035 /ORGANISM="Euplotes harpa, Strain FSP1.4" /LENGTH=198 /DNA_ID=CAMNT_0008337307 /DNA_START=270 /DNA_END=863 /DNA_ORIENTATION=+